MPEYAKLPAMTDPLGKHWGQPKGLRDLVRVYETHATVPEWVWRELPKYDSSYPSGVYAGKAWRRGPWLCWYGPLRKGVCRIGFARALIQ